MGHGTPPLSIILLQRDTLAPVTYMKTGVVYMGHKVDAEGIHPTNEKVEAIGNAPSPTCVNELMSYLGLLSYYGSFLPNLSTLLHSLHKLLRKEEKWEWSEECEQAFEKSKQN